jgi:hypothetical protein
MDRPGGGSSGLPYIQTNIPPSFAITSNPDTADGAGNTSPIFRIRSTGNLDYPIRGGTVDFQIGSQTFTLSNQVDKTRIKKFFEDKPRGSAFIQKQIGLQLSNPKIETGNTLLGFGQGSPLPGLLENTRVYNNGKNTLAQVGVQGTGVHAIRHGLMPFNPFQKNYWEVVNSQNINNSIERNRLYTLMKLKMSNSPVDPSNINLINTLGISLNKNLIFQYLGGPGSTYGIGVTTIKRAVDTTKVKNIGSINAMNYDQLMAQNINNITNGVATTNIQDFKLANSSMYDPKMNWVKEDTLDYKFFINKKDKLNKLYPFVFDNSIAPWEIDKENSKDIIKFVFEAMSNDTTSKSVAIFFRAFLTAGITDNNSAQLNAFKYLGRGENFYTYQGFERSIGFSFRVGVGSKEELAPLYEKINYLISQVYPDYSPKQGIMRAPLIRVTIGDYLYRVPGFLESVNVTVDNNSPWETNLDGDSAQLPQVVDISVTFKPIMDILPRRAPTTISDLSNNDNVNSQGTVPKLIVNNPSDKTIDPFRFKTKKSATAISDADISQQFQQEQDIAQIAAGLTKYNLRK